MEILESAMLLCHFYLTAATSFWTWMALIMAGLSFWRITAVGSRSHLKSDTRILDETPTTHTTAASTSPPPPPTSKVYMPTVSSSSSSSVEEDHPDDDDDGLTKGKFMFYYEDDDDDDGVSEEDEDEDDGEEEVDGSLVSVLEIFRYDDRVKLVPVVSTLHWRWYPYQDSTGDLVNHSVVRLWDYDRPKTFW